MTKVPFYATKGFIASGALLSVILILGAASVLFGGDSAPSSRPTATQHADATWGSRCGLPHGTQDPVVGPPIAKWTLVGHIAAPSVPGVGPGVVEQGDRRCYAHSPLGALLAAANFLPTTGAATDARLGMDHYAPGKLRDIYAHQPSSQIDPNTSIQTLGFRVNVLNRDAVDVQLALRVDGTLGYVTLPMRWSVPGDWRVQLLSAQEPLAAGSLGSLSGYIPWSV
jgi:hypothetical protein